ncbi:MAG: lipopolysaccharide biosynthesis protein [Akkermansia sp.]
MGSVRAEVISGVKWGAIQKLTLQPVQFVYGVILARLISPEDFGILALTGFFFAIAAQLQSCGLGAALIRTQDRTEADCSTMFWFNTAASLLFSTLLFAAAPWFADFFRQPPLVNLTRVSALMMFLNSTAGVHTALFSAVRNFKTPAIIGIISTLIPMPFTIWSAYLGWGYWALMVQSVLSGLLNLILIWSLSPWKPKLLWSGASFRHLFPFGIRLTINGLLTVFYLESRRLLIGKFYSAASLGNFNRGFSLVTIPGSFIGGMLGGVIYPVLAAIQTDEQHLLHVYRKYIRLNNIVSQFIMLTLACNARAIILLLYGPAWEEAVLYAQLICISTSINALAGINSNLYMVKGRTDIILKISVILRVLSLSAMFAAAFISMVAICWEAVFSSVLWCVLSFHYTAQISRLTWWKQCTDFAPYVSSALLANLPALLLTTVPMAPYLHLLLALPCSIGIYWLLLRKDALTGELLLLLKTRLRRLISKQSPDAAA